MIPTRKLPGGTPVPLQVGNQTVELELPRRASVRHAIAAAWIEGRHREQTARLVVAAALLLCWSEIEHKKDLPTYRHDIYEYGDAAIDFLLGTGGTMPEIIQAGRAALEAVLNDAVTVAQMEGARGNSEAPSGASTSSSGGSSAGTDSPTAG